MNALYHRIRQYVDSDTLAIDKLAELDHRLENRMPGETIVAEGERADFVFVIERGWAVRNRLLDDGRRQILNFMLPGDCFDLMSLTQAKSDHAVNAATHVSLRRISSKDFMGAIASQPALATAFWWVAIQEDSILREQIIRVGRRSATERLAHLFLELNRRQIIVTGDETDFLDLPISQSLLADALGLSVVHVSRTLAKLRNKGFVKTSPFGIEILDRERLSALADFDSRYLRATKLRISVPE